MIISYIQAMKSSSASSLSKRSPGRPREFNLDEALDRAIGLFSEQGYYGTSVSDLSAVMNVTVGSLYKAFPDKHAIFIAAFDRYLAVRGGHLAERLSKLSSGRQQIEGILRHYAEYSFGARGARGCLVVASAVELSTLHPDIARRIAQLMAHYRQRFQQCIAQGKQDGSVPSHIDAEAIAALLLCITQGMRVLGKTGVTEDDMQLMVATALTLVS
ncbi:TetR/AcrR family transcriptional regulator [Winslowiella iniecta]|nr:TetR/AcrR family transcriptional regulator [Winslowiella iniecta]